MNKKYFVVFTILLISIILIGCAETRLETVRNPNLSRIKFKKILVVAPFTDIGLRRQTENAFVSKFTSTEVQSVSSLQILPPIKDYTDSELMGILDRDRVDGILTIALKDYWTSQSYVPRSSSTQGSANLYGNSLSYSSYTQEYGGYYVSKPNVNFEIRLFDRRTGEVAWLVSSTTSGNAFADYRDLANSLAKKVVSELKKENMLVLSSTEIKSLPTTTSQKPTSPEKDIRQSPVAEFNAEPRTGYAPLEVSFDASGSYDPDGYIYSYNRDFKDGHKDFGEFVIHTFESGGSYKVELTVINNKGLDATISKMIIVRAK